MLDAEAETNDDWAIAWQAPVFPSRSVGRRNASKSRVEGKIVHSAHDNEDRGHIWSPLPITGSKHGDHSLSKLQSGVPPRHQLAYLVSTCDSGPTSGTTAVKVWASRDHQMTTKRALLGPRLSSTMLVYDQCFKPLDNNKDHPVFVMISCSQTLNCIT